MCVQMVGGECDMVRSLVLGESGDRSWDAQPWAMGSAPDIHHDDGDVVVPAGSKRLG